MRPLMPMLRSICAAFLLAGGTAIADGARTYDASLGTLPEAQGFGNTFGFGLTWGGSSPRPPTVVDGALHSDTTGLPGSANGHQFWFEYSDLYCDFREGVNFLEFVIKVNQS